MTPSPLSVLLADLSERSVSLQADGDRLRFRPISAVTRDLAERLKIHKAQLLAALRGGAGRAAEAEAIVQYVRANGDDDLADRLIETWHERLSICTTDGELTLVEAELIAMEQVWQLLDSCASAPYT